MEVDKESITKLHSEINYYLNQQYTLYVSAVTLLGAVMAWVSQRANQSDPSSIDVAYLGFSAVSLFLVLIAVLETRLSITVSICGTYLRLTKNSRWEQDIERFREASSSRIGLTTRGTYFIALGTIAAVWPVFLSFIVFNEVSLTTFVIAHFSMSLFYFISIFLLLPWGERLRKADIQAIWQRVLSHD